MESIHILIIFFSGLIINFEQGILYMKLNPVPILGTGGVEVALTSPVTRLANKDVHTKSQDLDLKFEDVKSANFYWGTSAFQGHHPITLKTIKVSSGGQSISFCSNGKPIKADNTVSLKKC